MPTTTTGVATTFIDFTRASNATVTDSDGKVKWAPHNLLLASESFDAASWVAAGTNITVGANSTAAPNGTTTADALTGDGAASPHFIGEFVVTFLSSAVYKVSVYVKPNGVNFIQFFLGGGTGYANFNVTSGSHAAGNSSAPFGSLSVQDVGGGWYLCSATLTNPANSGLYIGLCNSATAPRAVVFTTSSGVYLWGASAYRSDLGGMQPNTSAYPLYNPTTPKNLAGFTEDFSGTGWTRVNLLANGSGSVANAVVNPVNGLQTADLIVESTANGYHSVYRSFTSVANTPYLWSAYVKPAGRTIVQIAAQATTNVHIVEFNLTGSGTATTRSGSGTAAITALSDGWYRISTIATATGSGTAYWQIDLCNAANTNSYTGDGTSGIYLWGAQLSDSASLDSYSPVYGAAVTSAAYYGPRRDFDPVTLACKGLLVEEQRVNLLVASNDFAGASWSKTTGGTGTVPVTTAAAGTGLDGTMSATRVDFNRGAGTTSSDYSALISASFTATTVSYAGSIWIKAFSAGDIGKTLLMRHVGAGLYGTITLTANWQKYTLIETGLAGSRTLDFITRGDIATSQSVSVLIWGAQVEAGSFATSYIPVGATSAGATRNADVASVSTQAFPYSQGAGTFVVNYNFIGSSSNPYPLALDGGSAAIFAGLYHAGFAFNTDQGALGISPVLNVTGLNKVAMTQNTNDRAVSANGNSANTSTASNVPGLYTKMTIGALVNIQAVYGMSGHIRQITYLPRRISNADLVTRST